ncbi:MAG: hypothetical protein KJO98_02185, partial [Rhodothermia bacterium]|nr:hypothetical protein [Rhodothermia bacterium]
GHTFEIDFQGSTDSIRARTYRLIDVTEGQEIFDLGRDLAGKGIGPVGSGLLPIIGTPETVEVDTTNTGFVSGPTDAVFAVRYSESLPINLKRPGFPEDITITFADAPLDTSRAAIGAPALPSNFRIETESGTQLDFRFRDVNDDRTLSASEEFIEVLLPEAEGSTRLRPTWRFTIDEDRSPSTVVPPGEGDVYRLVLNVPFGTEDLFRFSTAGQRVDDDLARQQFSSFEPYVVPNPYVASAAFEPERFAVSGRGVRRIEFRGIPSDATIKIFSLRGELVQELRHDGTTTGMVPWDLRSKDNLEIAPGLYLFHVDAGDLGEHVGKFAIIK